MAKQAKREEGFDEAEDRQKVEPAAEAKPTPTANGARVRNAPKSIVGKCKLLAAHQAIAMSLSCSLCVVLLGLWWLLVTADGWWMVWLSRTYVLVFFGLFYSEFLFSLGFFFIFIIGLYFWANCAENFETNIVI